MAANKPKKKKPKKKKGPVVKDLFGDIMEEESQLMGDQDEEEEDAEHSASPLKSHEDDIVAKLYSNRPQEKSYTLTIISDPVEAGIDSHFNDYTKWLLEQRNGGAKPKRLVINAQDGKSKTPLLLNPVDDDKFRRQNTMVGKVVFIKDRDLEINAFERDISKWVPQFYYKMHQLCSRKPRFSEMRPTKYST